MRTSTRARIYGRLLARVPQLLQLVFTGASKQDLAAFDTEHVAPLHRQLGHAGN